MQLNRMASFQYFDMMSKAQKGYARLLEPICKKWELTRNELDVLLFLANNPAYDRAVDIVNNRGLSKSHVSLSINSLESRGLLLREVDPEDRRTVHLKLTEEAGPMIEDGRMAQKRFFDHLHQGVTQEQMDLITDFVRKVNENLKNIEEFL